MRFYRETFLEDMCLAVIVSNFNLLFPYFENSEFYTLFLRKKYSQKIYDKLKKNDMLEEEKYLIWLISPHWKEVVLEERYSLSFFVPKFQICGKFINSVNFKSSFTTVEILSAIVCLLPNVTEMNLEQTICTDCLLLLIRKMCPHLNSLILAKCQVSDIGMKNLCYVNQEKVGFPSLRLLDLEETNVKLHGVKYILSHLNLQVLMHFDLELALCVLYVESRYKPREAFKAFNLKEFALLPTSTPTLTLKVLLSMCPNVEKIKIMNACMEEDCGVLKKFQRINSLTILNVAEEEESPEGLSNFFQRKGCFLTELFLGKLMFSMAIIVKTCSNLKKLVLTAMDYQDFDETEIEEKHNLNKLLELKIKGVNLHQSTDYKSINLLLKSCKNLENLTIIGAQNLQEIFVDHIATNMPNLIKAKLFYTDINLISAKKLFGCKNIKYLYLDGCPHIKFDDLLELYQCCSHTHSNTLSWQIDYNTILEPFIE